MKILVSTDFSELSKVAVSYASKLASYTHHPLVLMNNVSLEAVPRAGVLINLQEKMEKNAIEDLQALGEWVKAEAGGEIDVFYEISRASDAAQAILEAAQAVDAGIIVMGTRGSSGLTGAVLGSVSSAVIRKSKIPVIAVPPKSEFSDRGLMVMAADPLSLPSKETVTRFVELCNKFNKRPEFFFAGTEGKDNNVNEFSAQFNSWYPETQAGIHKHPGSDPVTAINDFTSHNPCMLIALHPGHHNFFERIMGKSVTTKIMTHSSIPVLAIS
jgi:nucleotide-binding universal stress UspA family protein